MRNSIMIGVLIFTGSIKWFSGSAGGIFAGGLSCVEACKGLGAENGVKGGLFGLGRTRGEPTAVARDIAPDNPNCSIRSVNGRPAGAFLAVKSETGKRCFRAVERAEKVNPGSKGRGQGKLKERRGFGGSSVPPNREKPVRLKGLALPWGRGQKGKAPPPRWRRGSGEGFNSAWPGVAWRGGEGLC